MIAAFLPLPLEPRLEMMQRLQSTSHLDLQEATPLQLQKAQKTRYHGAKWWRTLNRGMSVVGVVVIAVAIVLLVLGVEQTWGH